MEVSNKHPSLELAYQFVIPSYANMLNRLAAVEDRIQRFMIFVATLTAAIPLIAVGLNVDAKHLSSCWTLLALISFFAFVIVSIRGRSLGEVVMIDPGNLNDEWQSKSREEFLRKCLKSVPGSSSNVDMGAPKVVFHEQREISKRPERQGMATLGTVAACSKTSRPTDQIPAQGGGERYSLCVAHRMRMANAPSRPASVAHHVPLLPHMASRWDHGADS